MTRISTLVWLVALTATSWQFAVAQSSRGCDQPIGSCDGQAAWGQVEGLCDGLGCTDGCNFWTRPTFTGDWHGLRTKMKDSGVTFAGRSTHFAFGVDGGIVASPVPLLAPGNTFKYTGRGEYDLLFDLEKFGGLPHGSLLVRAEHWYGQWANVSLNTGAFPPAVFPAAIPPAPNDPGVPYISNFLITQPLSEKFVVFVGKKDVLGSVDSDEFAGGDGTDQFVDNSLGILNRSSAFPERFKVVTAPHFRHDIQSNAKGVGMLTAKVDRVSCLQIFPLGWRNGNACGLQFVERGGQATEIHLVSHNHNIAVSAKLGRAVEHARLPAHKQELHLVA